jgi:hypothetical protein
VFLHRLPFTFKIYYTDKNEEVKENTYSEFEANEKSENYRESLGIIRRKSLDLRVIENVEERISKENKQISTENVSQKTKENREYLYTSKLATSIPLKLSIEIDRKFNVEKLIEKLRSLEDLNLEKESKYTELIIYDYKEILNKKLLVDECFQHNQTIQVYEVLTSAGIDKLFDYRKEELHNSVKLNDLALLHFNKGIASYEPYNKQGIAL